MIFIIIWKGTTSIMTRIVLTIALLISGAVPAMATHIVGGEFEITHIEGDRYLFRQIQYFDVVNGNPQAKDFVINASIFRMRDNVFIRSIIMRLESESLVPYSNPVCTTDKLITNRLVYSAEVTLGPNLFSDPEGYYMVWERCCRNKIITNIIEPDATGQTFYIEFPPIRKNGEEFRNSSPQLFPPLSDYACVNRFYYVDFRGYDPDGDSLVYSLATPLNSSRFEPLPTPTPRPHPTVTWAPGINSNYQIPGDPTLQIDENGFLTVTPSEEGLFVFSVRCEEYRDGVKIGEVVRDFQLFVLDCPDPGNKPQLLAKAPGSDIFTGILDTVRLMPDEEKCFDFLVRDKDGNESIKMSAVPVNFEGDVSDIFSVKSGYIGSENDTLKLNVCLPDCPVVPGEPMIIDVIARDNTCPQPLMDTFRIMAIIEPPPNQPPRFVEPVADEITASFTEGSQIKYFFRAVDPDGDSLMLTVEGVDFDLEEFGISLDTTAFKNGEIAFRLDWDTDCRVYPFAYKNDFQIKFYVEDADRCNIDNRDSVILNIHIILPDNNEPVVLVENEHADKELTVRVGEEFLFDVKAMDGDPTDSLYMNAVGVGFDLENAGMVFEDQEGSSLIRTDWGWTVECRNVTMLPDGKYEVLFIAEDADKCKVPNADTVRLVLNVLPPDNSPPQLFIDGYEAEDTLIVIAGDLIDLGISGYDADGDEIFLDIQNEDLTGELGIEFEPVTGLKNVSTGFMWQTNCDLLGPAYTPGNYAFEFRLRDEKCFVPMADTLTLLIKIQDRKVDYDFLPPNVFTPNTEDNINETYFIPGLPANNCENQFQFIDIYNRWGTKVFSSTDRNFAWEGKDEPAGVYFYLIKYTNFSVKGTVSLLR